MNEAYQNLLNRRSVRSYTDQPVPDALLDAVLEAGLYAPSGMNTQGVRLVAIRDPETIAHLSRLNAAVMGASTDPFYGAPCDCGTFRSGDLRWMGGGRCPCHGQFDECRRCSETGFVLDSSGPAGL